MTDIPTLAQPKKSSAVKWVCFGIAYFCLIIFMSLSSIDKAIDMSQEMGVYQIDKTREFLGDEKAQEMKEFFDERMNVEKVPTDNAATDTQ
ncbi:MAG: hypothetical protein ACKVJZ_03200 [Planctomycetota bacterium]|jgi:hypothetical protein|tara:strand:- start:42 stop:314 length:273 start_codon:yes stop_codon:yes gene_type:complete